MLTQSPTFQFEQDEVFTNQSIEGLSEGELLKIHKGLFKVSEVERVLNIPKGALRNAAVRYEKQGGKPYQDWGIGNSPISHWVVRMRTFSKTWKSKIKPHIHRLPDGVQTLPSNISADDLVRLEGVYRLADLKGKFPFSHQSIKNQARKHGDGSRDIMGCWKEGTQFYVDMQPFLKWLTHFKYS